MKIDQKLRECGTGPACPAAYPTDTARWRMQGPEDASAALRTELEVPDHERLIDVSPDVIDQIRRQPFMDVEQLGGWIVDHFDHDSFRVEFRDRYIVPSDEDDFRAYLAGGKGPDMGAKQGWLDFLSDAREHGRTWRNLHVIDEMTDYLRFELEWCYPDNVAAGADVRILHRRDVPAEFSDLDDYYIVDGHAAVVAYDREGHYLYALPVQRTERLVAAAERLWEAATPFTEWAAAHPEHRRGNRHAA